MSQSPRTFSFVDRICSIEPGAAVRGRYAVPRGAADFSSSLVVEAVGQLAAWAAMARLDFQRRPVAGIAGSIEFLNCVEPGQEIELSAEIESVDAEAVAYCGLAARDGKTLVRLQNCVGPMINVEHFDDPQSLRARFTALCSDGGICNHFEGVPCIAPQNVQSSAGQSITGQIQVPET